ncbi:MAG: hypothetical protein WCI74_08255, partial [Actinomycetes bacterium]
MNALSPEQTAGIAGLTSIDDDADGLTNTEEAWWCTDPLNVDSDGDGVTDGAEVQAAKDWLGNRRNAPPASGKPFAGLPAGIAGCQDDDHDDVPDLAERWTLGLNMKPWLNMNNPSTDRDRYNDGMELFGFDHTGAMSPIVKAPGNHPFVAAYPVIHVDAVPSTFHVETVTELHLDTTVITGTAKTYGTAETRGTSDSNADTTTWNDWQEIARTTPLATDAQLSSPSENPEFNRQIENVAVTANGQDTTLQNDLEEVLSAACDGTSFGVSGGVVSVSKDCPSTLRLGRAIKKVVDRVPGAEYIIGSQNYAGLWVLDTLASHYKPASTPSDHSNATINSCNPDLQSCVYGSVGPNNLSDQDYINQSAPTTPSQDRASGSGGTGYTYSPQSQTYAARQNYVVSFPVPTFVPTKTVTRGTSTGGAHTTTHTEFQEHTVSTADHFSTQTGWTSGWARNTAHAADLTFSYRITNVGTDYARSLSNLIFNVYIGSDPHPAITCQMNNPPPDRNCNLVSLSNVMPGAVHEYTTGRIWLSFEQMQALDLGGPIYVVVDSYSLGDDDVFFQNARQGGMTVVIDDGAADGDESLDVYVLPTWEGDTVLDVLARYFPTRQDADGNLLALSTPEWTTPPTWIERPLTDASWFNLYLDNLGDGSIPFRDTPAQPNSTLLMRYQTDSDRDGYTDRSELRVLCNGQLPCAAINDPALHPTPGLIAGLNTTRAGNVVTGRLAFLNTGNYDAYGVEAIMYAPDHTVSIGNNTIGGGGRVKAASQVVLGSRAQPPGLGNWTNSTAQPFSAGGYVGNSDKVFTFTAQGTGAVGGSQPIAFAWNDGSSNGAVTVPAAYQSPLPVSVVQGVEIGFYSGTIVAGDAFTVAVQLPRDTFTYTVQTEPPSKPGVVVSYNDPQGNHRFIAPVELTDLGTNLAPYAGQMLAPLSLEIATTAAFTPTGSNTTNYVFDLPDSWPIVDGHLFVEYVKDDGTVVAEQVFNQDFQPGPNAMVVTWNTGIFTETYQADHDYNILALVTDWQGNIIQSIARPLSSFQADPKPAFAMATADATWDFGTAAQGTLLKRSFTFANTGALDLLTYVSAPAGLTVSQTGSRRVGIADMTTYEMALNTANLPVGLYDGTITIRTSDPDARERTVHVVGTVTAAAADTPVGAMQRPLDWPATVSGTPGQWVDFTHTLGPEPQTLHPVKVWSQDYASLKGVGKYATPFGTGTTSYDMFGDGRDGDLTVLSGQTVTINTVRTNVTASGNAASPAQSNSFAVGDTVMFHQTQGT